ncbi:MAG TPA: homoserine kinase [Kiloniellaceae bacterium]|nr:homoserine kinase [Kiloniellaceae bacterium]
MAVYTEVFDEDLTDFLRHYDLGDVVSFKGIAEGVENSNYLLQTTRDSYILTLYEKRVEPADLPFFLGLMRHLSEHGITCPTPVADRNGQDLRQLCGRPAAIISYLEGLWPKRIQPFHCAALGGPLAEMHLAGEGFALQRPNSLSVAAWRPLLEASAADADQVCRGLASELTAELDFLEAQWPQALPAGIVHADLFPDNVFFRNKALTGFIDFYFACNDYFAYDLAICLNAWCFEPDASFNITKARLLLNAYRAVRPLSADELAALPLLARGSAMRFLLTRLYDWLNHPEGALVRPKDPLEYQKKLRFHQAVRGPADYGLDL